MGAEGQIAGGAANGMPRRLFNFVKMRVIPAALLAGWRG